MESKQVKHSRSCAEAIRARALRDGDGTSTTGPRLTASIAAEIGQCCGHTWIKAFRLAHGWTVQRVVQELHLMCTDQGLGRRGLTDRSWKEWEAGRQPSDDYRDLLCRLFRTGPVQLGFAVDYSPAADVAQAGDRWGEMHRRGFLGSSAALAFSAWERPRRSGRISPETLADLAQVAAVYRRAYRATPASPLLAAGRAHLELARSLRPDLQPEHLRVGLVAVMGEMAALAGVILLLDRGDPDSALSYLQLAWGCAREADCHELQAIVLGARSYAAGYFAGDHRNGLELAEAGCAVATVRTSPEARGWVAAVASERAASLGQSSACRQYLDAAREALHQPPAVAGRGIGAFDVHKLKAFEGGNMVRLGRFNEAEPLLSTAIDHLAPDMHRHRCTALIDRAEARLGAGEVEAACQDGADALELVAQVQHAGNLKRLRDLARRANNTGAHTGRRLWVDAVAVATELKGPSA